MRQEQGLQQQRDAAHDNREKRADNNGGNTRPAGMRTGARRGDRDRHAGYYEYAAPTSPTMGMSGVFCCRAGAIHAAPG